MKNIFLLFILLVSTEFNCFAQKHNFEQFNFIIGSWAGDGAGFGNNTSKIEADYLLDMNNNYIEVVHDSKFIPTTENPSGEHHIDKGFISFDKIRGVYVFRQFNIEGYVNQYVMIDSLSTSEKFVFETESIENFMPGGKARWTIVKISDHEIETIFDVSFPGKEYSCFGTNSLKKKK